MIDYVEKGTNCDKKMPGCRWRRPDCGRRLIGYVAKEITYASKIRGSRTRASHWATLRCKNRGTTATQINLSICFSPAGSRANTVAAMGILTVGEWNLATKAHVG